MSQIDESVYHPISTLPTGRARQIFLKNDNGETAVAMLFADGTMIDSINVPEHPKTFHATHWAHPKGMIIRNSNGEIVVGGDGEILKATEGK